ncbi:unnamed protein product [Acanthosepion pharaonis]|uniref:Uncharacterized protein n=1 Tax=Acanthosepion pharaonis TaxID=158019 RepID=A0A812CHB4_ACAPH|nr:unnamed protein product [Sepia pharaonis]
MITYLYIQFYFFIIVLSFLFHVSSFLSLFFLKQIRFHTLSVCNRDIHFLPLSGFLLCFPSFFFCIQFSFKHDSTATGIYTFFLSLFFFFLSSLHNSACNRDIYFLPLWFSLFFKRSLYSQRRNSFASSVINNESYRLQFGVIEQKYMFLYFLSGVAWDELDKFHHYQMSLIFPFISYQRFDFDSCSFKDKTATDSQVIF